MQKSWAAMQETWQERYIDVGGVKTHYLEAGEGETLVLVHGGLAKCCAEIAYGAVIEPLSKHFHVVAVDLVGYGLTPPRGPEDLKSSVQGDFLISFLRTLGGPVHLLGNSHGGFLVQYAAHQVPELVSRLILLNSGSGVLVRKDHGDTVADPSWYGTAEMPTREEVREELLAFYLNHDIVTEERIDRTFWYIQRNHDFAHQRLMKGAGAPAEARNQALGYKGQHISEWAGELDMPVLLSWSRENRGCSPEQAMPFFNRLKDGEMHALVNAGHHVHLEHLDRWCDSIVSFLKSKR